MKIEKYQPGTFIELDDMAGGRRVAMVCKDGVTFWDSLDTACCTPLTIHPSMHPTTLGTLVQYARDQGLEKAVETVVSHLQAAGELRLENDPLFVMRTLWFIARKSTGAGYVPDTEVLRWASEQAHVQEQAVARIHQLAGQYYSQ
ncbi:MULTISPECIES: hypothetical protein [Pseudomonas]|uniref:hypothetical protein n=1 Tax=Pseudomonas TaxID=286 RepID=UPI00048F281C|nr:MULTISPECIES: hypothetical protein [Pseudomonas]MBK4987434.1 hypothetical protein [Pseudomonas sp. S36]